MSCSIACWSWLPGFEWTLYKLSKKCYVHLQNEIVDLCTKQVVEKCTTEIKVSGMFSILADEAVDISNVEQMPIVIRYVDISNNKSIK